MDLFKDVKFTRQKPTVEMCFSFTTGVWQDDAYLNGPVAQRITRLQDAQLFSGVSLLFRTAPPRCKTRISVGRNNVTVEFDF